MAKNNYLEASTSNKIRNQINKVGKQQIQYASKGMEANPIDSGEEMSLELPTVVVTPRGNYLEYIGSESNIPTLQEFITSKANAVRIAAANKILKQKKPVVPRIPKRSIPSILSAKVLNMSDEERINKFGVETNPATCINTATAMYGESHRVPGNKTFAKNPAKYGFSEVPFEKSNVGDLVQFYTTPDHPYHMTLVTGINEEGMPALSYSNGASTEFSLDDAGSVVRSMKYDNDNWDFDSEENLYNWGLPKTYHFVGNKKDQARWVKEYNKLYSNKK